MTAIATFTVTTGGSIINTLASGATLGWPGVAAAATAALAPTAVAFAVGFVEGLIRPLFFD